MSSEEKNLQNWQYKVLPFVVIILSILVISFGLLYLYQVKKIQDSFLSNNDYNVVKVSTELSNLGTSENDKLFNAELISLLNRHYSASLIIKSRILTLNLSFLTGMILCFMGGLFVLGKFSEDQTKFNVGREKTNFSLSSSSPGIILSVLGVCLIAISIFSKTSLLVEDKPTYLKENYSTDNSGEVNIDDSISAKTLDSLKKITHKND